jgi:hypothetical protein
MVIYALLILLVLALMRERRTKSEEVEGSKYFYMTEGASKETYLEMHANGESQESLKTFVQMEDQFIGSPHIVQATITSNKIKETFPKYDFSYHTTQLKRISRTI